MLYKARKSKRRKMHVAPKNVHKLSAIKGKQRAGQEWQGQRLGLHASGRCALQCAQ